MSFWGETHNRSLGDDGQLFFDCLPVRWLVKKGVYLSGEGF